MKHEKENAELRELARRHSVNLNEIAKEMGVSDSTVYRWFRKEMDDERHGQVLNAIYTVGSTDPENRQGR